jgi:hypothetical protein
MKALQDQVRIEFQRTDTLKCSTALVDLARRAILDRSCCRLLRALRSMMNYPARFLPSVLQSA